MGRHENFPQALKNRTIVLGAALPYLDTPGTDVLLRCKIFEHAFRGGSSSSPDSLARTEEALSHHEAAFDRKFPALHDELEAYLPQVPPRTAEDDAKARSEFAVHSRMLPNVGRLGEASKDRFLEVVLEIHRRLGVGATKFRSGPVWTRRDSTGNAVVYPVARECPHLLERLHAFIAENHFTNPALCAVVGYVGLIQIHPFSDGNGRTARTFFNLLLNSALGHEHFVPLQMLIAPWRGGYIIKLRRAMYEGDLLPIIDYLLAIASMSLASQKPSLELIPSC